MHNKALGGNLLLAILLSIGACASTQAQTVLVNPIHIFQTLPIRATDVTSLFLGKFDGNLYGTAYQDRTNGTIFTLKTDGSGYRVVHLFQPGDENPIPGAIYDPSAGYAEPRVIQGSDGWLYGTIPSSSTFTEGAVFKLNPSGSPFSLIHVFTNGEGHPQNLMQAADGMFYGAGNCIFKLDGNGNNYTVLHSFTNEPDGSAPFGTLLQANNGKLYGTTAYGGSDFGTVFVINTNGTGYQLLHTFGGSNDGLQPMGTLIQGSDGSLYGTTALSLTNGASNGTVFKIDLDGNNFRILHFFAGQPNDGATPLGGLVEGAGQILYGTTTLGGIGFSGGGGTIFKIGLNGDGYSSLYFFTNSAQGINGYYPITGLLKGPSDGSVPVFYGSTGNFGGASNTGAIFAALLNPPLSISPVTSQTASNQTVLFWPSWAGTFKLQSTTNLGSSNWVNVTDGVPVYGVQVTSTNPAMFYRLVSP
jgi:uncharacterized repeat protein (TIGR03803 family)